MDRPPPPSRLAVTALFTAGLLLAVVLAAWAPLDFVRWTDELASRGNSWFVAAGPLFLAFCTLLATVRWLLVYVCSFREHLRQRTAPPSDRPLPSVSILVPAFNEGPNIDRAMQSLRTLDYPHYEVVFVDDGSTDDTLQRVRRYEGGKAPTVLVHSKPNGGKWSALNLAFQHSTGELVLCVDTDSHLDRQALRILVDRLADPHLTAVTGQVRVRNRDRLLTRLQALEYLLSNGAIRMAQSWTETVLVVPGPLGLYRRSALEEIYLRYGRSHADRAPGWVAGPYEPDTFAEDFDLSLAVLYSGGRIAYDPRAVAHTRAPEWMFPLLSQRYRWARGSLQVLRKYAQRAWRDPALRQGRVLLWVAAAYLFYLLIQPILVAMALGFLCTMVLTGVDVTAALVVLGGFQLFTALTVWLYALVHGEQRRLLLLVPLYEVYQAIPVNLGWAIGIVDELRGGRMRW